MEELRGGAAAEAKLPVTSLHPGVAASQWKTLQSCDSQSEWCHAAALSSEQFSSPIRPRAFPFAATLSIPSLGWTGRNERFLHVYHNFLCGEEEEKKEKKKRSPVERANPSTGL